MDDLNERWNREDADLLEKFQDMKATIAAQAERIAELEAERDFARRDQRASEQAATDANRENHQLTQRIAALEAAIRHAVTSGQPLNWFHKDVARCAWCGCFAEREPHYVHCPWTALTDALARD